VPARYQAAEKARDRHREESEARRGDPAAHRFYWLSELFPALAMTALAV